MKKKIHNLPIDKWICIPSFDIRFNQRINYDFIKVETLLQGTYLHKFLAIDLSYVSS